MLLVSLPPSFTKAIGTFKKHGVPFEETTASCGDANGLDGDDVAHSREEQRFKQRSAGAFSWRNGYSSAHSLSGYLACYRWRREQAAEPFDL